MPALGDYTSMDLPQASSKEMTEARHSCSVLGRGKASSKPTEGQTSIRKKGANTKETASRKAIFALVRGAARRPDAACMQKKTCEETGRDRVSRLRDPGCR